MVRMMSFPSHRKDATADRVNDGRPFLIGIMGTLLSTFRTGMAVARVRSRRAVAAAIAATAVASGCSRPIPAVPEAVVPTSSMTATPRYTPRPRPEPSTSPQRVTSVGGGRGALTCRPGEKLAMGFGDVEEALGARVARLMIRNCGTSTTTVPVMPKLQQSSESGVPVSVTWKPYDPKATPKRLAPGGFSGWELSWHSNGDCEHRGARRLVATEGTTTAALEGCLDLGGSYALTGESSTGPDGSDAVPTPEAAVRLLD